MNITLQTDGGSRGNPGPSAAGVLIKTPDKEYVFGFFLGVMTNNQAEYLALIHGLRSLMEIFDLAEIEKLEVRLDSELLVKQMKGEYRVKDPNLQDLKKQVDRLVNKITAGGPKESSVVQFSHIYRKENSLADYAVNVVLDIQKNGTENSFKPI
jgi:ribonuclease HI